jgi:hypothetical protein
LINLKEDANVFIVDWSEDASKLDYIKVAHIVDLIGYTIGSFIESIRISVKQVHCIGHSLGAHVCGFCGKFAKIGRISGIKYIYENNLITFLDVHFRSRSSRAGIQKC